MISKPRLQELVREIDPTEQLDEEVEELLLQIADDFIENTVNSACLLAKHRKVPKVEVKDVQLHLERNWNMWIPGFGTDELRPYKRAAVTEAHKQRLALIRKAIKKYWDSFGAHEEYINEHFFLHLNKYWHRFTYTIKSGLLPLEKFYCLSYLCKILATKKIFWMFSLIGMKLRWALTWLADDDNVNNN